MRHRAVGNIGKLVLGSVLSVGSLGQGLLAQAAANPILPHADPFITLHPVKGRYLLLATTGHNITIWSGKTIPTAASEEKVVFAPTDGLEQLWSPTLWQMEGHWWIYFTARPPGGEHAIYVLESDTADALGSYSFKGALNLGRPAIDPSVLTVKGVNYLMYVTVDRGENAIQMVRLEKPMEPLGAASLIAEPEYPWEKGAGSSRTYPVDEGPTALYHEGKVFVVFSASDTASPLYCLGLLTFQGGDPLDRKSWTKDARPVFSASPENNIFGPGRATFAMGADGVWWLLYAAKSTDAPTAANREVRAQRFTWNADGTPNFGMPVKDGPIEAGAAASEGAVQPLAYEVATVKPPGPNDYAMPLRQYIQIAYGIPGNSKGWVFGPEWVNSATYVIHGKAPDAVRDAMKSMSREERGKEEGLMMRALLADRFKLKAHFETREMPLYELRVAKGGAKLKEDPDTSKAMAAVGDTLLRGTALPMHQLCSLLEAVTDIGGRMVVDKTGLTGTYDFNLKWTKLGGAASGDAVDVSVFTAMEETLGLKLVATKGQGQVLVIDHIERPSEN
jgi:uncharacterized protein (TIGR03435 family)